PLPGALPATYGHGSLDANHNGYLDADESVNITAELYGTSLQVYLNGLQYGPTFALNSSSAAAGETNGVSLHKNRLGSSGGFLSQVASNVLVDNLDVAPLLSRPGDFNGDGVVDSQDYLVWRRGLGQSNVAADYRTWRDHFGDGISNQSAS